VRPVWEIGGHRPVPASAGRAHECAILVLNAGSSSLKFSLFEANQGEAGLSLAFRGTVDGLDSHPRFVVADANGRRIVNDAGPPRPRGTVDHEAALSTLLDWVRAAFSILSAMARSCPSCI
jgi:acetate kinase